MDDHADYFEASFVCLFCCSSDKITAPLYQKYSTMCAHLSAQLLEGLALTLCDSFWQLNYTIWFNCLGDCLVGHKMRGTKTLFSPVLSILIVLACWFHCLLGVK